MDSDLKITIIKNLSIYILVNLVLKSISLKLSEVITVEHIYIYIHINIDQRNPYDSRKSRRSYARETQLFRDLFPVIERNNLFNFIATFEKRYKEFLYYSARCDKV